MNILKFLQKFVLPTLFYECLLPIHFFRPSFRSERSTGVKTLLLNKFYYPSLLTEEKRSETRHKNWDKRINQKYFWDSTTFPSELPQVSERVPGCRRLLDTKLAPYTGGTEWPGYTERKYNLPFYGVTHVSPLRSPPRTSPHK